MQFLADTLACFPSQAPMMLSETVPGRPGPVTGGIGVWHLDTLSTQCRGGLPALWQRSASQISLLPPEGP
jgi:hypothetical protein